MICGISGITWMNPSDIYDTNHIISITQASTESWTKWSYEIIITRYSPRGEINFRVEFSDENNMNARDTRTSPLFQFSSDHKDALLLRKPKIISRISSRSRLEIRLFNPAYLPMGVIVSDEGGLWNGQTLSQSPCIALTAGNMPAVIAVQGTVSGLMMTSSNGNIFRVTGPLCGEFTGPGEFPTQRPVTRSFDVFFDLRMNKRLSKQPWGWWFETPSWSLWRHSNAWYEFHSVTGHCSLPRIHCDCSIPNLYLY